MTRIIGDIHGKTKQYFELIKDQSESIQVGDFGFGFEKGHDRAIIHRLKDYPQHRFIRGNHDSPKDCKKSSNYLKDWDYNKDKRLFTVGGAWSIDYYYRVNGLNWWSDEELSQDQFDEAEQVYVRNKPEVVISHDCPATIAAKMGLLNPAFGGDVITRTGYRLALMFSQHKPKYWFFGHWHKTKEFDYNGCHFHCIGELDYVDFDFEKLEYENKLAEDIYRGDLIKGTNFIPKQEGLIPKDFFDELEKITKINE